MRVSLPSCVNQASAHTHTRALSISLVLSPSLSCSLHLSLALSISLLLSLSISLSLSLSLSLSTGSQRPRSTCEQSALNLLRPTCPQFKRHCRGVDERAPAAMATPHAVWRTTAGAQTEFSSQHGSATRACMHARMHAHTCPRKHLHLHMHAHAHARLLDTQPAARGLPAQTRMDGPAYVADASKRRARAHVAATGPQKAAETPRRGRDMPLPAPRPPSVLGAVPF